MKWKRVLAFVMSAALLVSAPFTNASLVHAEEAAEQESGAENAEPEGEEAEEAWSGIAEYYGTDSTDEAREAKIWKPSDSVPEQSSGVKVSSEMLPRESGTETAEPTAEQEKSGRVTIEETEGNAAASELLKNGGGKKGSRKRTSE